MHEYVQKSINITLPRSPARASGAELSQLVAPLSAGSSPSTGRLPGADLSATVVATAGLALRAPLAELEAVDEPTDPTDLNLGVAEREHILRVLRECSGMIGGANGAAERLGLKRTTPNSKIKKLGIKRRDYI